MLHATALGVFEATVNGQAVSAAVLEPPHTNYRIRLVYATYNITGSLRLGITRCPSRSAPASPTSR